jgi:hypothetical protein
VLHEAAQYVGVAFALPMLALLIIPALGASGVYLEAIPESQLFAMLADSIDAKLSLADNGLSLENEKTLAWIRSQSTESVNDTDDSEWWLIALLTVGLGNDRKKSRSARRQIHSRVRTRRKQLRHEVLSNLERALKLPASARDLVQKEGILRSEANVGFRRAALQDWALLCMRKWLSIVSEAVTGWSCVGLALGTGAWWFASLSYRGLPPQSFLDYLANGITAGALFGFAVADWQVGRALIREMPPTKRRPYVTITLVAWFVWILETAFLPQIQDPPPGERQARLITNVSGIVFGSLAVAGGIWYVVWYVVTGISKLRHVAGPPSERLQGLTQVITVLGSLEAIGLIVVAVITGNAWFVWPFAQVAIATFFVSRALRSERDRLLREAQ